MLAQTLLKFNLATIKAFKKSLNNATMLLNASEQTLHVEND